VEAKPIRKLDGKTALKFVKDIVVRFGIPHSIITAAIQDGRTRLEIEFPYALTPLNFSLSLLPLV
jgi:hypothetical protein